MFEINKYKDQLIDSIGQKRFDHSVRVVETALNLNKDYNEDEIKMAALLHDCAKNNEEEYWQIFKDNIDPKKLEYKQVLHSFLGAEVAKKVYNISNENVLNAIRFHTTGRENMTYLDKIVYISDAIEPKRDYPGVDKLRKLASKDLDEAILFSLNHNIEFLINKNALIHPLTIDARNYLIKEKND